MKPTGSIARAVAVSAAVAMLGLMPPSTAAAGCENETWTKVGQDEFRAEGLPRSQGVTSDGDGWIFSWQAGISRTDDAYLDHAVAPIAPDVLMEPRVGEDGSNHVGGNHIGDVDTYGGLVYAPIEDNSYNLSVTRLNQPRYQYPTIALYDAKTLVYTGVRYAMPVELHAEGIPWVAVNGEAGEVYTAEWDMPHDRINVFDLQMNFLRFIDLHYPESFGPGFHLSRIQGAKVLDGALYATRDDDAKSVFKIDLATGDVSKMFSIDPGVPSELEGLAIRPTSDGALLHLLIVVHNDVDASFDFKDIAVEFQHYARTCA